MCAEQHTLHNVRYLEADQHRDSDHAFYTKIRVLGPNGTPPPSRLMARECIGNDHCSLKNLSLSFGVFKM